ncbi:MAG TPA: hypothetical protein VGH95_06250 [Candidatus Aquirickettsiella sp.]|jgi:PhoPQ-activated pathogenicity-related protein
MDIIVNEQETKLIIPNAKQGWRASYVELDFPDGLRASTPIFISPDAYPKNQIMSPQGMCLLITPEHKNIAE